MIKEAERWSVEHTGVGLSETELELVKFLEEKFTSDNSAMVPCNKCKWSKGSQDYCSKCRWSLRDYFEAQHQ